jgi:broad specificity phosphatase PhoE
MTKLILIKHASPFVIPGTPPEKWRLSDKGRDACAPLAEALRPHAPAVIVTSDEPKAKETAQLVADALKIPLEIDRHLREHDRSNVPHMRSAEFISHVELMFRKPAECVLGSESADEAFERFDAAVRAAIDKHPGGNVAVVSHGTVIALFIARHADHNPFEWWRKLGLPSFVTMTLPDFKLGEVIARTP